MQLQSISNFRDEGQGFESRVRKFDCVPNVFYPLPNGETYCFGVIPPSIRLLVRPSLFVRIHNSCVWNDFVVTWWDYK